MKKEKIIIINGGLGNQMFQYAFYKNMKKNNRMSIDLSYFFYNNIHNGYELEKIFGIREKEKNIFYNKNILEENYFFNFIYKLLKKIYNRIGDIYVENRNDNIEKIKKIRKKYFLGVWSSEKYFEEIKDEIRDMYTFPKIGDEKNLKILEILQESNETISIHIRRGDYLSTSRYSNLSETNYYVNAISIIKEKIKNPIFLIFSNDIEWCKENLNLEKAYYIDWNKGEDSYRDMQLMSLCHHNIIANSTFSWWGAWLNNNPNKIVIAPKKYFSDKAKGNTNSSNFYPESWIKL